MATARNEVPRPAFRAGDTSITSWQIRSPQGSGLGVADRTDSPTGSRMAWTQVNTYVGEVALVVPLPGLAWLHGMQVRVEGAALWFPGNDVFSGPYVFHLLPAANAHHAAGDLQGLAAGTPLQLNTTPDKGGAHYVTGLSGTVTAPPAGYAWRDQAGQPLTVAEGGPVWLGVACTKGRSGALARIRVDLAPTELAGYFDGSTTGVDGWLFSWDGTPHLSTSTGTGPDPEPEPDPEPDPEPVPELVVGTPATYPVWQVAGSPAQVPDRLAGIPPGMADDGTHKRITGTPTAPGDYLVALDVSTGVDTFATYATVAVTVAPAPPEVSEVMEARAGEPAALAVWVAAGSPTYVDPDGYHMPPTELGGIPPGMVDDGTHKVITGTPTTPGTYAVTLLRPPDYGGDLVTMATVDVTILPALTEPDPDPEPDPGPDPDPDPADPGPWDEWDALATALAPRVAAFVGRPGDADVEATALAQLPVVAEYIRGYTRGHGFTGAVPESPLRAVLVSACARLATNPEQVVVFTTGDYSERPAQLAGWTLAEIHVLRRYRRTAA